MAKKSQLRLGETNRPKLKRHMPQMTAALYREYATWLAEVEHVAGSEKWAQSGLVPPGIPFFLSDWTPRAFYDQFKEKEE